MYCCSSVAPTADDVDLRARETFKSISSTYVSNWQIRHPQPLRHASISPPPPSPALDCRPCSAKVSEQRASIAFREPIELLSASGQPWEEKSDLSRDGRRTTVASSRRGRRDKGALLSEGEEVRGRKR